MDLNQQLRSWLATGFAVLFLTISVSVACLSIIHFIEAFQSKEFISGIILAINDTFIALATFELGMGIAKEYRSDDESNIYIAIRRTITRFVSVVIIALVLEGLIMVIKYSQLEMAGNLYYPVAVIAAASVLLISLAVFLSLTRQDCVTPNSDKAEIAI